MHLDPKALEAAAKAIRNDIWQSEPNPTTERYLADLRQQAIDQAEAAIRAFLSASIPADVERRLPQRLDALREHLTHQPLTHADDVDLSTIAEAASALRSQAQRIGELEKRAERAEEAFSIAKLERDALAESIGEDRTALVVLKTIAEAQASEFYARGYGLRSRVAEYLNSATSKQFLRDGFMDWEAATGTRFAVAPNALAKGGNGNV